MYEVSQVFILMWTCFKATLYCVYLYPVTFLPIPACLLVFHACSWLNALKVFLFLGIPSEIIDLTPALTLLQGNLRTETFKLASIGTSQVILAYSPSCVRPGTQCQRSLNRHHRECMGILLAAFIYMFHFKITRWTQKLEKQCTIPLLLQFLFLVSILHNSIMLSRTKKPILAHYYHELTPNFI